MHGNARARSCDSSGLHGGEHQHFGRDAQATVCSQSCGASNTPKRVLNVAHGYCQAACWRARNQLVSQVPLSRTPNIACPSILRMLDTVHQMLCKCSIPTPYLWQLKECSLGQDCKKTSLVDSLTSVPDFKGVLLQSTAHVNSSAALICITLTMMMNCDIDTVQ